MNARQTVALLLAAAAFVPIASMAQYPAPLSPAQFGPPASHGEAYSRQELDQMLAPIALYPDALLSQVLMAATFPEQVAEAARWSSANPGLQGEQAVQAAQSMGWDPSVEYLTAFPQVLARMAEHREWTGALGDAFLAQEAQIMDAVQDLRRRAQAAGTLGSDDRLLIGADGPVITIEPVQPQVMYVPYYDPSLMYGAWPWASYPPVYWSAWSGYRVRPGFRGFTWGPSVAFSAPRYNSFDWRNRRFHRGEYAGHRQGTLGNSAGRVNAAPRTWQGEPNRRFGGGERAPFAAPRAAVPQTAVPAESSRPRADFRRFESRRATQAAPAPQPAAAPSTAAPRTFSGGASPRGFDARPRADHGARARPPEAPVMRAAPPAAAPAAPRPAETRGPRHDRPAAAAPAAPAARAEHPRGGGRHDAGGERRGEGRGRS